MSTYPTDQYAVWVEALSLDPGMVVVAIPMRSEEGLKGAVLLPLTEEVFLDIPKDVLLEMLHTHASIEIEKQGKKL